MRRGSTDPTKGGPSSKCGPSTRSGELVHERWKAATRFGAGHTENGLGAVEGVGTVAVEGVGTSAVEGVGTGAVEGVATVAIEGVEDEERESESN